jgi:hypothetical protein
LKQCSVQDNTGEDFCSSGGGATVVMGGGEEISSILSFFSSSLDFSENLFQYICSFSLLPP